MVEKNELLTKNLDTNQIKEPFNVYCNNIEVLTGQYDIYFKLSQSSPNGNKFLGEILMSPEHAKVFANILNNQIAEFESLFGEIPYLSNEKLEKLHQDGKLVSDGEINE